MKIITEEMRFRQRLCEYALKYGVTKAARKYQTNRQFVYRQLKKYDGVYSISMLWAAVLSDNSDRRIQSQTGTEDRERKKYLRNR